MNLDLKLQSAKGTSLSELERLEAFTNFFLEKCWGSYSQRSKYLACENNS